jgi:lipoate-protein ligase A
MNRFLEALVECYGRHGDSPCCLAGGKTEGLSLLSYRKFTSEELDEIETIAHERFENPDWIYGREPAFTYRNKKRFPGGGVEVFLDVKGGVIRSAKITGDFLALHPVTVIEEALAGVQHTKEALEEALRQFDVASILGSIDKNELLETLL